MDALEVTRNLIHRHIIILLVVVDEPVDVDYGVSLHQEHLLLRLFCRVFFELRLKSFADVEDLR